MSFRGILHVPSYTKYSVHLLLVGVFLWPEWQCFTQPVIRQQEVVLQIITQLSSSTHNLDNAHLLTKETINHGRQPMYRHLREHFEINSWLNFTDTASPDEILTLFCSGIFTKHVNAIALIKYAGAVASSYNYIMQLARHLGYPVISWDPNYPGALQVQRSRLRHCLKLLDEEGIRARTRGRLRRRTYNVSAPNSLWHIDSNHKLIRWHFVIIGGVDGFSRLVTYLKCTDNNKSETVFQCFKDGITKFGVPDRVRSDQGRENIKVADFMIQARGPGRGSMLTGKSTHNQRIERLWRDVYDGVLTYFYDLFYFLEDEGQLDILNDSHLFALHYVFTSKINERLQTWQGAWNNHRIRTVNSTPMRLYTAGMMDNQSAQAYEDVQNVDTHNSSDDDVATLDNRPLLASLPTFVGENRMRQLSEQCPQNWVSENHGIDIYLTAKQILTD